MRIIPKEGGFYPRNLQAESLPPPPCLFKKSSTALNPSLLSLLVSWWSWLVVIQVFQQNILVALGQGQGSSSLGFWCISRIHWVSDERGIFSLLLLEVSSFKWHVVCWGTVWQFDCMSKDRLVSLFTLAGLAGVRKKSADQTPVAHSTSLLAARGSISCY